MLQMPHQAKTGAHFLFDLLMTKHDINLADLLELEINLNLNCAHYDLLI